MGVPRLLRRSITPLGRGPPCPGSNRDFERRGGAGEGGREPAVGAERGEAQRLEAPPVEARRPGDETVLVALGLVLAGEGLEEGDAAAQGRQARQPAVERARR